MKRTCAILLFLFLFSAKAWSFWPKIDTTIQGIAVEFNFSDWIYPESWRISPINGKGESLSPEEFSRSSSIITRALKKYPLAVLRANLTGVYILRTLKFYDVGYGGTNSTAAVYIANNGVVQGYSDAYVEQTFHHEFSSILFRNFPDHLDQDAWLKANPPGFDYNDPESGVGAIRKNESSQLLDTTLCGKGFLTQYALSGMENDINTVAQNLFMPSQGFWKMVETYPAIRIKTNLLIQFYHQIDPLFDEIYFRKLSK